MTAETGGLDWTGEPKASRYIPLTEEYRVYILYTHTGNCTDTWLFFVFRKYSLYDIPFLRWLELLQVL